MKFSKLTILYIIFGIVLIAVAYQLNNFKQFELYFLMFFTLQFLHSVEEQLGNFHKRWPLMKISRTQFSLFEYGFLSVWAMPLFFSSFPGREFMLWFFPLLMFANGVWHIAWFWFFEKGKRYVPGIITAPFFVLLFVKMYLELLYS